MSGIGHLHSQDIVHRDLKPENFLVTKDGTIKISDLSLSQKLVNNERIFSPFSISGTPGYAAPEILRGEFYGRSADLFSAGVVL